MVFRLTSFAPGLENVHPCAAALHNRMLAVVDKKRRPISKALQFLPADTIRLYDALASALRQSDSEASSENIVPAKRRQALAKLNPELFFGADTEIAITKKRVAEYEQRLKMECSRWYRGAVTRPLLIDAFQVR